MSNGARSNAPGLVVGLCFIALGALLLADRLGLLQIQNALEFWPIALILLGGSLIVQSMRTDPAAGPARPFPVGAVIWLVLLGLFFSNVFERRGDATGGDGRNQVHLFAVMSGDRKSPNDTFRGAEMTSVMGGTVLDLRSAKMAPGEEAVIDVFSLMGGAVVYAPRDWIVDVQTTAVMGGVKDERFEGPGPRDRRRPGRRGDPPDSPDLPDLPDLQDPPDLPDLPGESKAAEPAPKPGQPEPVERETPGSDVKAPKIILRGFVMMGGLVVKG